MVISSNAKKNIFFYFGLSLLFFLIHTALTSSVSFFHFLLEHDMATIDGWISKNRWELLVLSKLVSFYVCLKFLRLNYKEKLKFWDEFKDQLKRPSIKGIFFSLFLIGVMVLISRQFYTPAKIPVEAEGEFISSYLGIIFFLLLDMAFLFFLTLIYKLEKVDQLMTFCCQTAVFSLFTFLTIPYLSIYLILALLHFITLYYFTLTNRFSDGVFYCVATVAPMNSLLGLNLFSGWEESRSYEVQFFLAAIVVWLLAFGYERFSRLN